MSYYKEINLAEVTGGIAEGHMTIYATYWETRYSWGHKAEIAIDCTLATTATARYYNRTWEAWTYQSVIHSAIYNYVKGYTGIDPLKPICKRDTTPMKSETAEKNRKERVAKHERAEALYNRLIACVDGRQVTIAA